MMIIRELSTEKVDLNSLIGRKLVTVKFNPRFSKKKNLKIYDGVVGYY